MNPTLADHKLRYEHYVCFPDDGYRHEIIDGVHYMNAVPSTYHQAVSRRLQYQLYSAIELKKLGCVINAPVDVHLAEYDIVQPDLVVVLEANRIITPSKVKGTPDLLVEILSPSTRDNDLVLKRKRYEAAGVPEYWIVDPFDHTLEQLILTNGSYVAREHGDIVQLSVIEHVSVDLNEVW